MRETITLTADVPKSARVVQVSSAFDVPINEKQTLTWDHTLPIEDKPWQVGLIVGPSGAGKSVLARRLWGDAVRESHDWPDDKALVDGFPKRPVADITGALTAVGFGTIPAWLRPYRTLSNGERFRADMARSLVEHTDGPIVIDEFTSVVDRQVAKVASHAVQKTIRRRGDQFVAVTCHYDVEDWLQPDWTYDVAAQVFTWRLVQPHPPLNVEIYRCDRALWRLFARHHYLSGSLHTAAKCFAAYVDDRPVAFTSYRHFPHHSVNDIKMGHRLVVLPDWQGLGIAARLEDWLGERLASEGFRYRNVVGHPDMIRLYARSPRWRESGVKRHKLGYTAKAVDRRSVSSSRQFSVRSFEYVPTRKAVTP